MVALARDLWRSGETENILDFPQTQGKSNEWFTPSKYIEAAREVMGSIDLDPASCELANQTVKATRFYSATDNGLTQEWHGNVWLNPPYALDKSLPNEQRSTVGKWVGRLVQDYSGRAIEQAVLLSTCMVNSSWFDLLWQFPICFPRDKIRFYLPDGCKNKARLGHNFDSHMFGTVFVYLGPNTLQFIDVFSEFGTVARRVSQSKQSMTPLSLWNGTETGGTP